MPLLAQYLSASAKPLNNGFEPDWPKQPWLLPRSDTPVFAARLGHDVQLLAQAVNWLSKADFQQLPRGARAEVRDWRRYVTGRAGATLLIWARLVCICTTCARMTTCGGWLPAKGSRRVSRPFCMGFGR